MTSKTGQEIFAIHVLPSIYRGKGNQAMKFGQLIKYSVGNTFPSKIMHTGFFA